MYKKLLFSAALIMPFSATVATASSTTSGSSSSFSSGHQQVNSVDSLREMCKRLEQNDQIKFFSKGILCKGSHTVWKYRPGVHELLNYGQIQASTSYIKAASPLQTAGSISTFESTANTAQCHIYDQFRIYSPQTPIFVQSCDDLTAANVEKLCLDAIQDQCEDACDPFDTQCDMNGNGSAPQDGGACQVKQIGTFNSCDLYNHVGNGIK